MISCEVLVAGGGTAGLAAAVAAARAGAETLIIDRCETIRANAFIDATGDSTLTALAGANFTQTETEKLQRPAYLASLRGLDHALLEGDRRLRISHLIVHAVKSGELPPAALGAGF